MFWVLKIHVQIIKEKSYPPELRIASAYSGHLRFPGGSTVNNLPAMQETQDMWGQSLGQEDNPGEGMATHPSILAWRIPMDRGAWWATVHGITKSWAQLSN